MLGLRARRWLSLAQRSRVGAESEDEARCVLEPLGREGSRVRHSVSWPRGGDIDSVVLAPSGLALVIETGTLGTEDVASAVATVRIARTPGGT